MKSGRRWEDVKREDVKLEEGADLKSPAAVRREAVEAAMRGGALLLLFVVVDAVGEREHIASWRRWAEIVVLAAFVATVGYIRKVYGDVVLWRRRGRPEARGFEVLPPTEKEKGR
jgi:hypothetical protein